MQVSQIAELDTHAVIGGSKAKSFFMSDSAEFFALLSNTLYRDKKLAVIREVLCNAHDAHVMGGCIDKHIEITLTDKELSIKDFGPGISDDRMHPVYCGYGVSTKVDDDTQIGGFGLGCKAPFAYSDHFTVASCHEGKRTVYAISRGGVDTDGKPGLHPMVTVPTTETGITVSIPIKDRVDQAEFKDLIERVVRNGSMIAKLNGVELKRHDFSGIEKTGFGMLSYPGLNESSVYVRLGSILYPVTADANSKLALLVESFRNDGSFRIIINARPGQVGITPSREALSNSDQTVEFVTNKLNSIKKQLMNLMPRALTILADETIQKIGLAVVPQSMKFNDVSHRLGFINHPEMMAVHLLRVVINQGYSLLLKPFKDAAGNPSKALLKAAARKYPDHRRVFRRLANDKVAAKLEHRFLNPEGWQADGINLLIRMACKLDILKYVARKGTNRSWDDRGLSVRPLTKDASAFASKPKIVLVRSREQASVYCSVYTGSVAFIVVRTLKPEKIAEIKRVAKSYKFEVHSLDLSKPEPKKKEPKPEPVKETFYQLSDSISNYGMSLNRSAQTIKHAPVFIDCGALRYESEFRSPCREIIRARDKVLQVYPKVALSISAAQKKALIAAGSRELTEVFTEDLLKIQNTPQNLFIVAAVNRYLFTASSKESSKDRKLNDLVGLLCESDLRAAKLLDERRVVVNPREERIMKLLKLHSSMVCEKAQGHMYSLKKAAQKEYSLKRNFDYLKPLGDIAKGVYYDTTVPWSDELGDMIRFLRKRHAKTEAKSKVSSKTKAAVEVSFIQSAEQPMKEAA